MKHGKIYLIDGKNLRFGYYHKIEVSDNKNIKVYHTEESLNNIEKATRKEIEKIIKKSNLMCER